MKIPLKSKSPTIPELIDTLNNEREARLSYEKFGMGVGKTVVVKKSFCVGAEITCDKQSITVERLIPSIGVSMISNFFTFLISGIAAPLWRLGDLFGGSDWQKFEKEITQILYKKYGGD